MVNTLMVLFPTRAHSPYVESFRDHYLHFRTLHKQALEKEMREFAAAYHAEMARLKEADAPVTEEPTQAEDTSPPNPDEEAELVNEALKVANSKPVEAKEVMVEALPEPKVEVLPVEERVEVLVSRHAATTGDIITVTGSGSGEIVESKTKKKKTVEQEA